MDLNPGGEQEGEEGVGVGGNERIDDKDDAKEKGAAWSFVSFSSEGEDYTQVVEFILKMRHCLEIGDVFETQYK